MLQVFLADTLQHSQKMKICYLFKKDFENYFYFIFEKNFSSVAGFIRA